MLLIVLAGPITLPQAVVEVHKGHLGQVQPVRLGPHADVCRVAAPFVAKGRVQHADAVSDEVNRVAHALCRPAAQQRQASMSALTSQHFWGDVALFLNGSFLCLWVHIRLTVSQSHILHAGTHLLDAPPILHVTGEVDCRHSDQS